MELSSLCSRDFQNRGQCPHPSLQHTFTPSYPKSQRREPSLLQAINPIIFPALNLSPEPQRLHPPSPRSLSPLFPGVSRENGAGAIPNLCPCSPSFPLQQLGGKSPAQPGKTSRMAVIQSQPADPTLLYPKPRQDNSPFLGQHPPSPPALLTSYFSVIFSRARFHRLLALPGSGSTTSTHSAAARSFLQKRCFCISGSSLELIFYFFFLQGEMEEGAPELSGFARREERREGKSES